MDNNIDESNVVDAAFWFNEEMFDQADLYMKLQTKVVVEQILEHITKKINLVQNIHKA